MYAASNPRLTTSRSVDIQSAAQSALRIVASATAKAAYQIDATRTIHEAMSEGYVRSVAAAIRKVVGYYTA